MNVQANRTETSANF